MKTVDQLVSEWTEEEREKLKDLIEECRERERKISESSKRSRENLTKINESLQSFLSSLYGIKERTEKLADDLLGIYLHFNKKQNGFCITYDTPTPSPVCSYKLIHATLFIDTIPQI